MNFSKHGWSSVLLIGLMACGGSPQKTTDINNNELPNTSFVLRANVEGLNGQLVLVNHESDPITISSNGLTTLPALWSKQETFQIRVKEEPCLQRCVVNQPVGDIEPVGSLTLKITCDSKRWDIPSSESDAMSIIYSDAQDPSLAMNRYGDVILSWFQSDNFNQHLFKREFINRSWNNLDSIVDHFSFDGSNATNVSLALNENFEAAVVWSQMAITDFTNIFLGEKNDSTWAYSPNILNVAMETGSEKKPLVRMNASGDKIVVWSQNVGSYTKLFKSEYRNGSWSHPATLADRISIDGSDVEGFDVAINDLGETVIVWNQSNGANLQIYKAVYRNGGWTFPTSLSNNFSPNGSDSGAPRVAMNNAGDIYITWHQKNATTGGDFQIFTLESHDSGLTWDEPSDLDDNISPDNKAGTYPKVVVNDQGKAVINYRLHNTAGVYQSYALIRASSTANWTNKRLTVDDFSQDQGNQAVDMDEYGNIVFAWSSDGNGNIYKAEYRNGVWLLADQVSPINSTSSTYNHPAVAVNNCRSVIAWQQDGTLGQKQIFIQQYR